MDAETREWLEPVVRREKATRLYGYLRVYYLQSSLDEPGVLEDVEFAQSYWWNGLFERWMELTPVGHDMIEAVIQARGVFDQIEETRMDLTVPVKRPLPRR